MTNTFLSGQLPAVSGANFTYAYVQGVVKSS